MQLNVAELEKNVLVPDNNSLLTTMLLIITNNPCLVPRGINYTTLSTINQL